MQINDQIEILTPVIPIARETVRLQGAIGMQTHQTEPDAHEGLDVLIPIDGSEVAMNALKYARLFPLSSVSLVHVIPKSGRIQPLLTDSEQQRWAAGLLPNLTTLRAELGKAGIESSFEIRVGNVAEEIVTSAKRCDLTVMTTSGRGAIGRALFGSIADRVSRNSTTSTLLIRGNLLPDDLMPCSSARRFRARRGSPDNGEGPGAHGGSPDHPRATQAHRYNHTVKVRSDDSPALQGWKQLISGASLLAHSSWVTDSHLSIRRPYL